MDASIIFKKRWTLPVLIGGVGLISGFVTGYVIGSRKTESKIFEDEEKEINLIEEYYNSESAEALANKPLTTWYENDPEFEGFLREEKALEEKFYAKSELEQEITIQKLINANPEVINVIMPTNDGERFDNNVVFDEWDFDHELAKRDSLEMYVIHRDEFMSNESDYGQETLTYYAGDDLMADPQDVLIYNYSGLMGDLKFGCGSYDPNVVYIRNDSIHMEWEILRHSGKYEVEVGGLTIEEDYAEKDLKHSVHKFKET